MCVITLSNHIVYKIKIIITALQLSVVAKVMQYCNHTDTDKNVELHNTYKKLPLNVKY